MRIHVSYRVKDLEASARLYSRLFGAEPSLRKHDYARWSLDQPAVSFAIVKAAGEGGLDHLGIQAESLEELAALRARHEAEDLEVEGETTCCYARSEKAWLTDLEGIRWELFYTHHPVGDAPSAARVPSSAACCDPGCCEPGEAGRAGEGGGVEPRPAAGEAACCEPGCCAGGGS